MTPAIWNSFWPSLSPQRSSVIPLDRVSLGTGPTDRIGSSHDDEEVLQESVYRSSAWEPHSIVRVAKN